MSTAPQTMTEPAAAEMHISFGTPASSPADYSYGLNIAATLTSRETGVFVCLGSRKDLHELAIRAIRAGDFGSMAEHEFLTLRREDL